jgi:hypothetical protein
MKLSVATVAAASGPGALVLGRIPPGRSVAPAPVLVLAGWHDAVTNRGSGLAHIELRHGDQIRAAGFRDPVAFAGDVTDHCNEISGDLNGQLVPVRRDPARTGTNDTHAVIIVRFVADSWHVETAGRFKSSYISKRRLLWQAVHTAAPQPTGPAAPSNIPPT